MQESQPSAQAHHLPQQVTHFVGREQELADINRRLADPACRLLTLVGPGGIGKTRLAIQTTAGATPHFPGGAFFVNLQPIQTETFLITAIADALDISLSAQEPPLEILRAHLAHRRVLLTLDNFEQLLDAASVLAELLVGTQIKILVTSRETLNLQEEWLYPLSGMSFPFQTPPPTDFTGYSAIQLFADRAQRVRPDFALETEIEPVMRICQMVEGMPLALELAAPWIRSMSCAGIAAEIERNREFLATRLRNVPERHRSLQAIFTQTWDGLDGPEQTVFQRLAVFRGGFLRDAANRVAGATLPLLSSLLDKSLLRRESEAEGDGRYQIHELLRQYAEEQLLADPTAAEQTSARHGRYYATFLDQHLDDLLGGRQIEAMAEIEAELNNIRAAWQWAIDHREAALLLQMSMPLVSFYWYQSRYREANDAFAAAVACLETCPASAERDLILAASLTNQAWFCQITDSMKTSLELAERSLALYEQLDAPPVRGLDTDPRLLMGLALRYSDRIPEAISHLQAALAEAERRPNPINQQCAHRLLAQAYHMLDDLEPADHHARIACQLADQQGDLWGAAYNHDTLGRIALAGGDYETAEQHLRAGYTLQSRLRFAQGLGDICQQLTDLYLSQGNLAMAQHYATEGLGLYEANYALYGELAMLARLAHLAVLRQDLEAARSHLLTGLERVAGQKDNFLDTFLYMAVIAANILMDRGDESSAWRWLAAAVRQPHLRGIHRRYATDVLDRRQIQSGSPAWETAIHEAETLSMESLYAEIKAMLLSPFSAEPAETGEPELEPAVDPNQALLDPLTNRELEVLHLIAAGLSNRQIAAELIISTGTVKYYTSQIYSKLQVPNRTRAIAYARELGILPE